MTSLARLALGAAVVLASALAAAGPSDDVSDPAELAWDARAARHLLNRAGFGAAPDEVRRAVELGHEGCVALLLCGADPDYEPFYPDVQRPSKAALDAGDRKALRDEFKEADRVQMAAFGSWWVDQMIAGGHPLREKVVLFWHGHFTSSYRTVKDSGAMIAQNELFRTHGLGSFRALLREVLRDRAMLLYLDGAKNSRRSPNENLARELMELFTLGPGNYTERDVQEAARALTGWSVRRGRLTWSRRRHDGGVKTILGETGRWREDDLVEILLARPECARWVAGRLLEYFEGVEPDEARRAEYAARLAATDYDVGAFLEALFLDPSFYRDEVVGQRVAGPVELLVGHVRRLRADVPPLIVVAGSAVLGQRLFHPPDVRGWEGGMAWISTSTYQARGNFAGMLLGVVELDDVLSTADLEEGGVPGAEGDPAMAGAAAAAPKGMRLNWGRDFKALRRLRALGLRPRIHLTERLRRAGLSVDGELARALLDDLLAVDASKSSRRAVVEFLRAGRVRIGCRNGELLEQGHDAETLLRRTAHVVLSLPEAQLN